MIDEEPQWREEREHGVSTGPFFQSSTIRYDTIRRGFVHARDGLTTDFTGDSAPGGWSRILGRELQSCPVTHKQLTVTTHTHSSSLIPVSAPRVKTGHTHAAHGSFALLGLSVANFIINTKVMERKRRKKKKRTCPTPVSLPDTHSFTLASNCTLLVWRGGSDVLAGDVICKIENALSEIWLVNKIH